MGFAYNSNLHEFFDGKHQLEAYYFDRFITTRGKDSGYPVMVKVFDESGEVVARIEMVRVLSERAAERHVAKIDAYIFAKLSEVKS